MDAADIAAADARYRARLESLLAVDEMVGNLVSAVSAQGELKNTVFIFTSDNGFFHGEHRVRTGKVLHYEESSSVPLIIRGPGVPKGVHRPQLAANIDLAPTILDFANAKSKRRMDGRTLLPMIDDKRFEPGRGVLIEGFNNATDEDDPIGADISYSAVRTNRYVYAETAGEQELYDLTTDPFELQSRHSDPSLSGVKAALDSLLGKLTGCAGKNPCAARPKLKLKFKCLASGLRVQVVGADADQVESRRVRRSGKNRFSALVTTLDGRRTTVSKRLPQGCL